MKNNKNETWSVSCIIVDDEAGAADSLESLLAKNSRVNVLAKINDPRQAVLAILQMKPDLVWLDIQMPGMSGFDVLKAINHAEDKPFVIFVTAFDRFAIQAIKLSAFDYLLKPIDEVELTMAMERFLTAQNLKVHANNYETLIEQVTKKKIRFNTTGGFILINQEEIVYIQADWNYSEIHMSKEKYEVVTMNLGAIEDILPKGSFARINRSVIVNLAYLEKVQRGKRLCVLKKDDIAYEFKIPILRIRYLEGLV
jgi:two-component system LytT family response regulator